MTAWSHRTFRSLVRVATLCFFALVGCTSESSSDAPKTVGNGSQDPTTSGSVASTPADVSIPTVEYRWDPKLGDPTVPAELGGPGFTGAGWDTRLSFPAIGSSEAIKGGTLSQATPDWPATLRMGGQNWNTSINYLVRDLCFPALIQTHPVTLEHIPVLATHWQISPDKMTYRFRLNPAARWSDGSEVTADDYVASYKLWMDPTVLFPSNQVVFGKFEPHALSKYLLEIRCREENWRNFLYAGGLVILPAKEIAGLTGTQYLDRYQFGYTSFCGPYKVDPADVVMNQSVTLTRNPDWWDAQNPAWVGLYNIDKLRFEVVKDDSLIYERTKQGEFDYYVISTAKWFANDLLEVDAVKRGLLLRLKFFNDAPIGTAGIAINTTRAPLDRLEIRKALACLFDRETMIERLFYGEYDMLSSYWQGATYGNMDNKIVEYDEVAADDLLNAAGYTKRNADGWRVQANGEPLQFDLMYRSKGSEKFLTLFQESTQRLGIKIELKLLTPSTFWKNLQEKEYDLAMMNWGALVVPNPETSWKGELASQKNNNNVTAFSDPRVDQLLVEYDREYDLTRRRQIVKEIDAIVYAQHPYALAWYKPAQRVVVANKFGWPKWGCGRVHEDTQELIYTWWVDPAKEAALERARKDASQSLPIPPVENRFWQAWNRAQDTTRAR
ncbi:MAG: ABC transporter substrate-binding protein [Planctomycetota bacterium]